jgi:hypothetical protein
MINDHRLPPAVYHIGGSRNRVAKESHRRSSPVLNPIHFQKGQRLGARKSFRINYINFLEPLGGREFYSRPQLHLSMNQWLAISGLIGNPVFGDMLTTS